MAKPYKRGDSKFWWIAYIDATGRRRLQSSETTDEAEAAKRLAALERRVKAERATGLAQSGPVTVKAYAERWIEERRKRGVASTDDDETRLGHALKRLGGMVLKDVRPQHVRDMVRHLEVAGELAPRTILHVYGVLRVMFSDAVIEELIPATPCVLKQRRGDLPKKRDKDPRWRPSAIYTRDEVQALISDHRLAERKRVLYAIEFLCGVRVNEVTPRRWRDYDPEATPLGALTFATSYALKRKLEKSTKTGNARVVPVHPTLAKVLAAWRLSGWQRCYGRAPTAEDLIVPSPVDPERFMSSTSELKRMHESLAILGLRARRQHDARRTFVSLGQADGGRREVLETITHDPKGDITSLYTSFPWPTLCEAVGKLNIRLLEGRVLPLAANGSATVVLRQTEGTEMTGTNAVEAAGIELASFDTQRFDSNVTGVFSSESKSRDVDSTPEGTSSRSKRSSEYEARARALGFKLLTCLALVVGMVGCSGAPPEGGVDVIVSRGMPWWVTRVWRDDVAGVTCWAGPGPGLHSVTCFRDATVCPAEVSP